MPYLYEKVPRISPPSQHKLLLPHDRLCVCDAVGEDVAPGRGKLVVGTHIASKIWYNPHIAIYGFYGGGADSRRRKKER